MSAAWLAKCVDAASRNPEYVARWAEMRGVTLPKTPMDWKIDEATGRTDAIATLFIDDVRELIYARLPEPGAA